MSFIRYRYKSEKDFKLFPLSGPACSVSSLKQFLLGTPSKSGSRQKSKDDVDFVFSDASTNEAYRIESDLIPAKTSVIVVRRLRETLESLVSETKQQQLVSFDDITDRPSTLSSKVSNYGTLVGDTSNKATSEVELIKAIQKPSQLRYMQPHRTMTSTSGHCHYCKQHGHMKRDCPRLLENLSATKMHEIVDSAYPYLSPNKYTVHCNSNASSFSHFDIDCLSKGDDAKLRTSRFSPYHPLRRPSAFKTTAGIPRSNLIPVTRETPTVLRNKN